MLSLIHNKTAAIFVKSLPLYCTYVSQCKRIISRRTCRKISI